MKRFTIPVVIAAVVALGLISWGAMKQESSASKVEKPKAEKKNETFYGNAKCPIMGNDVSRKLFVEYADEPSHTHAKIYVCCPACLAAVKKDPASAYKKAYLDREIKDKDGKVVVEKGQPIDLLNDKCPMTSGKVDQQSYLIYNGYKIHFCCPGCDKSFMKDPDKNLAKLIKDQKIRVAGLPEPSRGETKSAKKAAEEK